MCVIESIIEFGCVCFRLSLSSLCVSPSHLMSSATCLYPFSGSSLLQAHTSGFSMSGIQVHVCLLHYNLFAVH